MIHMSTFNVSGGLLAVFVFIYYWPSFLKRQLDVLEQL